MHKVFWKLKKSDVFQVLYQVGKNRLGQIICGKMDFIIQVGIQNGKIRLVRRKDVKWLLDIVHERIAFFLLNLNSK